MEILSTWDYCGWGDIIKYSPTSETQNDWNSTILTSINKVAKKSGKVKGDYLIVRVPEHLRVVVEPSLKLTENFEGMFNKDVFYFDSELDIIEVNGFGLKILNYSIV